MAALSDWKSILVAASPRHHNVEDDDDCGDCGDIWIEDDDWEDDCGDVWIMLMCIMDIVCLSRKTELRSKV